MLLTSKAAQPHPIAFTPLYTLPRSQLALAPSNSFTTENPILRFLTAMALKLLLFRISHFAEPLYSSHSLYYESNGCCIGAYVAIISSRHFLPCHSCCLFIKSTMHTHGSDTSCLHMDRNILFICTMLQ